MAGRLKTKRKKLLFFLLFSLGVIIFIEIALRLFLYLSLNSYLTHHVPERYRRNMSKIVLGPTPYEYDSICYFLPKGGLFRVHQGQTSDFEKVRKDGIRIISTGDSTTYGLAVDYEQSYPFLLEKLLKEKYPDIEIQVLNAGFPGASERQVKRIFQFHLAKYNPDIVIFRKELYRLSDSYLVPENSNKIRHFVWHSIYGLRIFRFFSVISLRWCNGYPLSDRMYDFIMYNILQPEIKMKNGMSSDFHIVQRITKEQGIPYLMAVDFVRKKNTGELMNDCQQYEKRDLAPVACTHSAFEKKLKTTHVDEVFVDNEHLTEIGTSILAKKVYQFLVAKKWIEAISK